MDVDNCDDASSILCFQVSTERKNTRIDKRRTRPPKKDPFNFPYSLNSGNSALLKPCTHEGRAQPTTPAGGQDAACCVTQQCVRLTQGPCSPDTVRCACSNCARPSMTRKPPWSRVIEEGTSHDARRTWNSTELPKLTLTMTFG